MSGPSTARMLRSLSARPSVRVAVLRALKLGDLLCAVPALRALRAALPQAEVVLVGLPWAREFADRFGDYLDGFREFPGYPGMPEREPRPDRLEEFFAAMRAERFDLAVQLHGSGAVTNEVVARFGATRTAGFYPPGGLCLDPETFLPWPASGLEVHRLTALMRFLGAPDRGDALEFPLRDEDFAELRAAAAGELRPGRYVCVHPGASVPERRWPAECFAAVADELAGCGLGVVLTGTAGEAGLTRAVADAMQAPARDLAGKTGLGAAAALLSGARLLVCNDTGVSHLAAALRVPSVVISTGDNPARWAPTDSRRHRVLCRGGGVGPGEVLEIAADLLREFRGRPPHPKWRTAVTPRYLRCGRSAS